MYMYYILKQGGGDGDWEEKSGPSVEDRLEKLCLSLATEALDNANKRSWEDVFGKLAPVCEMILEDLEDSDVS